MPCGSVLGWCHICLRIVSDLASIDTAFPVRASSRSGGISLSAVYLTDLYQIVEAGSMDTVRLAFGIVRRIAIREGDPERFAPITVPGPWADTRSC